MPDTRHIRSFLSDTESDLVAIAKDDLIELLDAADQLPVAAQVDQRDAGAANGAGA